MSDQAWKNCAATQAGTLPTGRAAISRNRLRSRREMKTAPEKNAAIPIKDQLYAVSIISLFLGKVKGNCLCGEW